MRTNPTIHLDLARLRTPWRRSALALAALLLCASAVAQKPPTLIRQHLLEHPGLEVARVKSVEPFSGEALDAVLGVPIWKVAYAREGQGGESLVFMAVDEGEVLRVRAFDAPMARESLVRLLREDVRVRSLDDARRLVAAMLELQFGFPFDEPEMAAGEMRAEQRANEYFFVDGERFGDPTGYRVRTDGEGRVVEVEYSWELEV